MASEKIGTYQDLIEEGCGILKRLQGTRYNYGTPEVRPGLLADKAQEKVVSKLISKFPDIPDVEKISGFDVLVTKSKAVMDDLETAYYNFVDAYLYVQKAGKFLNSEAALVKGRLSLETAPVLCDYYFGLFTLVCKVTVFASFAVPLVDKKLTMVAYGVLYQKLKSKVEPHFSEASKWLAQISSSDAGFGTGSAAAALVYLTELFSGGTSGAILESVRELSATYAQVLNVADLRAKEALNITLKPAELAQPTNDYLRLQLLHAVDVKAWVAYGVAVTPQVLEQEWGLKALERVLDDVLVVDVIGDVYFSVNDMEDAWAVVRKKQRKLPKVDKLFKAHHLGLLEHGPAAHAKLATYLRQELAALRTLVNDTPVLAAPKLCVVFSGVNMARDEVLWELRHQRAVATLWAKRTKASWAANPATVAELVRLISDLSMLVSDYRDDVARYYAAFICGADARAAPEALGVVTPMLPDDAAGEADTLREALEALAAGGADALAAHAEADEEVPELYQVADSFEAVEYAVATTNNAVAQRGQLCVLRVIGQHARFIANIEDLLGMYCDLLPLYYFKEELEGLFERYVAEAPDCDHVGVYYDLLSKFPMNANTYWPEELPIVGAECLRLADLFSVRVAEAVRDWFRRYVHAATSFQTQMQPENIYLLARAREPDFKPPTKEWRPPAELGVESLYKNRRKLANTRTAKRKILQIVAALAPFTPVTIYDSEVAPLEYIRDLLEDYLKDFVRKAFRPHAPEPSAAEMALSQAAAAAAAAAAGSSSSEVTPAITQPSTVRRKFDVVCTAMSDLEHAAPLGLEVIWRKIMLKEFYVKNVCRFATKDASFLVKPEAKTSIGKIVAYYVNFVAKVIPASGNTIVYSPLRRGFFSRTLGASHAADGGCAVSAAPGNFRAENYTDSTELAALVSVIGPYGVKVVDTALLCLAQDEILALRKILAVNAPLLNDIAANYTNDAKYAELIKKLKDLDKFVAAATIVGNTLALRSLFKDAVRSTGEDACPHLWRTLANLNDSYEHSSTVEPEFAAAEYLAADHGLETGTPDLAFRAVMKLAIQEDSVAWSHLPALFAVMFHSAYWREAQFIPALEGYQNNLHTIAPVINYLIAGYYIATSSDPQVDDKLIVDSLTKFLEIASITLTRLACAAKADKKSSMDLASVMIFIDRFVESSPFLTYDMLENIIPYTLFRSMFRDLYAGKPCDGW